MASKSAPPPAPPLGANTPFSNPIPFTTPYPKGLLKCPPMQEFTGYLYKQGGERKNWKKRWFILRGNCLSYFNSSEDETPIKSFELNGYDIHEVPYEKFKKKMCFELFHTSERTYYMYAEHVDEHEKWLSQLAVATMPMAWGGVHRQELSTQGDGALLPQEITHKAAEEIAQLGQFERLRNVKSWQRRALLRKKMLLCSIHLPFRGSSAPAPDGTREYEKEKEAKRLALLELVDYIDNMRNAFNDPQAVCDVINMIVCNICRALPARDENADEEEEEEHFMEPTWPHLSIVYELLY